MLLCRLLLLHGAGALRVSVYENGGGRDGTGAPLRRTEVRSDADVAALREGEGGRRYDLYDARGDAVQSLRQLQLQQGGDAAAGGEDEEEVSVYQVPAEGHAQFIWPTGGKVGHRVEKVAGLGRVSSSSSWSTIAAYAADQLGESAAGRGPRRHPNVEADYARYKRDIEGMGLSNHEYLAAHTAWNGRRSALEPNLVPYHVEHGISHLVLWHHPDDMDGASTELDPSAELEIVREILGERGCPPRPSEAVIFQNVPSMRSVPTIAHSHVFLRPADDEAGRRLAAELAERREAWRSRSPFDIPAEFERAVSLETLVLRPRLFYVRNFLSLEEAHVLRRAAADPSNPRGLRPGTTGHTEVDGLVDHYRTSKGAMVDGG